MRSPCLMNDHWGNVAHAGTKKRETSWCRHSCFVRPTNVFCGGWSLTVWNESICCTEQLYRAVVAFVAFRKTSTWQNDSRPACGLDHSWLTPCTEKLRFMLVEATGVYTHDIWRRDARDYTRLRQSKLDVVWLGPYNTAQISGRQSFSRRVIFQFQILLLFFLLICSDFMLLPYCFRRPPQSGFYLPVGNPSNNNKQTNKQTHSYSRTHFLPLSDWHRYQSSQLDSFSLFIASLPFSSWRLYLFFFSPLKKYFVPWWSVFHHVNATWSWARFCCFVFVWAQRKKNIINFSA